MFDIPSGKHTKNYGKWPSEIVDLSIRSGDFPVRDVSHYHRVSTIEPILEVKSTNLATVDPHSTWKCPTETPGFKPLPSGYD